MIQAVASKNKGSVGRALEWESAAGSMVPGLGGSVISESQ